VLAAGKMKAGDKVELLERPRPEFPFNALLRFFYASDLDVAEVRRVAESSEVARELRDAARGML
jgi:MOSC domain-containing protein YiiM